MWIVQSTLQASPLSFGLWERPASCSLSIRLLVRSIPALATVVLMELQVRVAVLSTLGGSCRCKRTAPLFEPVRLIHKLRLARPVRPDRVRPRKPPAALTCAAHCPATPSFERCAWIRKARRSRLPFRQGPLCGRPSSAGACPCLSSGTYQPLLERARGPVEGGERQQEDLLPRLLLRVQVQAIDRLLQQLLRHLLAGHPPPPPLPSHTHYSSSRFSSSSWARTLAAQRCSLPCQLPAAGTSLSLWPTLPPKRKRRR